MTQAFCQLVFTFVVLMFPAAALAQNVAIATKEEIASAINSVPCKSEERLDGVRKAFLAAGAKEEEIEVQRLDKISNIVVRKKGETEETVIVGAHYDRGETGCDA